MKSTSASVPEKTPDSMLQTKLLSFFSLKEIAGIDLLANRLVRKYGVDGLSSRTLLVAYGGGKDSTYTVAFLRAVQLRLANEHGSTFMLRSATMRHAGVPKAVMENIDRVYRRLDMLEDDRVELLVNDLDQVRPFHVDLPFPESLRSINRRDILLNGHRTQGDGRPTWAALPPALQELAAQATRVPAEDGELGHSLKTSAFTAFVRRPAAEAPPQAAAQAGPAGPSAAGPAGGAAVPWQMVGSVAQQQTQLAAVFQMMAQAVHEQMLRQVGSAPAGSPNDAATRRRAAALLRFREKKKNRSFKPKVRYESRKRLAESRPRIKGQFVKPEVAAAAKARGEKVDYS